MRNTLWALAAALAVGAVPSAAVAQLPAAGRPMPPQAPATAPVPDPQQDKDRRDALQALRTAHLMNYPVREPVVAPPHISVPTSSVPSATGASRTASEIAGGFRAAETASHVRGAGGLLAGLGAGAGGIGALFRRKNPSA
jgi:hypothetical protein